jgi:hypothetical protein
MEQDKDPMKVLESFKKSLEPIIEKAQKTLNNLPTLEPEQKKIIFINDKKASLSITEIGIIILKFENKNDAQNFYLDTNKLTSEK